MFEKYNDMSLDDLNNSLEKQKQKQEVLTKEENFYEKKARKNLYFWFILPVFGLFAYYFHLTRRKSKPEIFEKLHEIKNNLGFVELEIMIIKTKIENYKEK